LFTFVHTGLPFRITDPEILERRYPVLLREFSYRRGSGGSGKWKGGDGLVRILEPLTDLSMNILSERRSHAPYGLAGGGAGSKGVNLVTSGGVTSNIGGKRSCSLKRGDVLILKTPGGGGWGEEGEEEEEEEGAEEGAGFITRANGSLNDYSCIQNSN